MTNNTLSIVYIVALIIIAGWACLVFYNFVEAAMSALEGRYDKATFHLLFAYFLTRAAVWVVKINPD